LRELGRAGVGASCVGHDDLRITASNGRRLSIARVVGDFSFVVLVSVVVIGWVDPSERVGRSVQSRARLRRPRCRSVIEHPIAARLERTHCGLRFGREERHDERRIQRERAEPETITERQYLATRTIRLIFKGFRDRFPGERQNRKAEKPG
jgi:hypothetical protein